MENQSPPKCEAVCLWIVTCLVRGDCRHYLRNCRRIEHDSANSAKWARQTAFCCLERYFDIEASASKIRLSDNFVSNTFFILQINGFVAKTKKCLAKPR